MISVDVATAAGKKHLSLCRQHAATVLKHLAQEAGEHHALMEVLKAREGREERRAIAREERATLSDVARERGIKNRS